MINFIHISHYININLGIYIALLYYQVKRDKAQITFKIKPSKNPSKDLKHLSSTSTTTPATAGPVLSAPQLSTLSVHLSRALKDNNLQVWKGKHIMYPTAVVLATTPGSFGQISASHTFTK